MGGWEREEGANESQDNRPAIEFTAQRTRRRAPHWSANSGLPVVFGCQQFSSSTGCQGDEWTVIEEARIYDVARDLKRSEEINKWCFAEQ